VEAVKNAEAIYIGGGNTFQLLKTLYDLDLIKPIQERVLKVFFLRIFQNNM
jgi:dipeptidase E